MSNDKQEPEVVAYYDPEVTDDDKGLSWTWGTFHTGQLISMQAYREALAPLQEDRLKLLRIQAAIKIKGGDEHYPTEWAYLQACKVIDSQKEAIAKKDAALKACVEAMYRARNFSSERIEEVLDAAITQAQEALK